MERILPNRNLNVTLESHSLALVLNYKAINKIRRRICGRDEKEAHNFFILQFFSPKGKWKEKEKEFFCVEINLIIAYIKFTIGLIIKKYKKF